MSNPLFNFLIVKIIADQRNISISPGGLIASTMLPGVVGIALPLALAQNNVSSGQGKSLGIEDLTTVPDVNGKIIEGAEELIKNNKLKPIIVEVYHEEIDAGRVVDQEPLANLNVSVNSDVILRVSRGPAPASSSGEIDDVARDIESKIAEVEGDIAALKADLDNSVRALQNQITTSQAAIINTVNSAATKTTKGSSPAS